MLRKLLTSTAVVALTLGCAASLYAADPADLIKYRKNTMDALGGHAGAIGAIMGGKSSDAQAGHLKAHIQGVALIAPMVKDLFPPESASGDKTDAKKEIWDKPAEFKEAIAKLEKAASDLAAAGDDKAKTGEAVKGLFGACKNCHDNFRVKK
ncbi:MAG: cytochrome c [Gammaproteobacteria bacterium]